METSAKFRYLTILTLISPFMTSKTSIPAETQELLGDTRLQIELMEADFWEYAPWFDCWENTTAGQIAYVLDKLPETTREKIKKLKTMTNDENRTSAEAITPVTRFHKWVYIVVQAMEPRVAFLRTKHGNFRKMCSFCANIVYLRETLKQYPSYRHVLTNDTLQFEPSYIEKIRTALKMDLDVDDEAIEDLTSLFNQEEEIRKDCFDDQSDLEIRVQ